MYQTPIRRGGVCYVWLWLWAAAVGAAPGTEPGDTPGACPLGCHCARDDMLWYYCGDYIVKVRDDGYVEVNCQEQPLNCSQLPTLAVGNGGALHRLELTRCALPPTQPLACANAALGVDGVESLALQDALAAPNADNARGLSLDTLFMSFAPGAAKQFPIEAVNALPSLRHVRLQSGTALALPPRLFSSAPPLLELEVAMSGVKALPPDAFRGLTSLRGLSLWGNSIRNVSVEAFAGLESLEQLVLNGNPLGRLPPRVFAPAPRLRRLFLERLRLAELEDDVFGGLPELQELKIRSDVPLSLSAASLAGLPSLTALSLTQSSVALLPEAALRGSSRLLNLTLSRNRLTRLPADVFADLGALQRLDLSDNALEELARDTFRRLTALTHLDLDGNRLEELPDRVFSGLASLRSLSVRRNRLTAISYSALLGASALTALALAHNQLDWSGDGTGEDASSPFNMLHNLQSLDLSHNAISYVFSDWRYVLLQLRELNLSYNNFTELMQADLQFLGSGEPVVVDLRHNSISRVQPRASWVTPAKSRVLLDDNPFACDCQLYDFAKALQASAAPYEAAQAACASPGALAGRRLAALDAHALTCPLAAPSDACACLLRPARARLECDCADLAPLPDPADVGFAELYLRLRAIPAPAELLDLPPTVRELNLTGLNATEAPAVPPSVRLLDLSDNLIGAVPPALLRDNMTLYLTRNPLVCECGSSEGVARLQRFARRVADYAATACADGAPLSATEAARLCDARLAAAAALALAAAALAVAALAFAARRYRLEARALLLRTAWGARLLPAEPPDAGKRWDVFVSFAAEDEAFVLQQLLPRLEPRYSLHVQERDWEPGASVPAQLHRAVAESRRTLLVLSPRYLRSLWAEEALRAVHAQAAADGRARAAGLLLAGPLPRDARRLLARAPLVRLDDRLCWDKLAYALPRGAARRDARPAGGLHVVLNDKGQLVNQAYVKD